MVKVSSHFRPSAFTINDLRTLGALFFLDNISDGNSHGFAKLMRGRVLINGTVFVLFFLAFLFVLFMSDGYSQMPGRTKMGGRRCCCNR